MGILKDWFGIGQAATSITDGAAKVIDSLGSAGDKLFTSDAERAQWAVVMEKARQQPQIIQGAISMVMAKSGSRFVAGARAAIMYALALTMIYNLIVRDLLILVLDLENAPAPAISVDLLLRFISGMFGMAA